VEAVVWPQPPLKSIPDPYRLLFRPVGNQLARGVERVSGSAPDPPTGEKPSHFLGCLGLTTIAVQAGL
jgi:hypothetical protein